MQLSLIRINKQTIKEGKKLTETTWLAKIRKK